MRRLMPCIALGKRADYLRVAQRHLTVMVSASAADLRH
jgi:hypothetical protein